MSEDTLNPILNPDCEPVTVTTPDPTPCEAPLPVDLEIEVLAEDCPSCDEIIVPAAPVVADISLTTKCYEADPAYKYVPAQDCIPGSGMAHFFYEVHPACVRPMQQCNFCIENALCPEDIGLVYRKGDNNVFSVTPAGAVQPLLFHVHDGHIDHVLSEIGYIKVGQADSLNEWVPRECMSSYVLSPAAMFPGALQVFLNAMPHIGTIPTVVTETAVTSVLDPVVP